MDMEQVYQVIHQMNNALLERIKERIVQTLLSEGKEIIQEPDNPSKSKKEDSIPDIEKRKKTLHHLKTRKTKLVILMRRRVVPMIFK